jgi:hypothetical protein
MIADRRRGPGPAPPTRRLPDYAHRESAFTIATTGAPPAHAGPISAGAAMNDDYDYRATFDFSQADWKAIERALTMLEEKFAILDDYDETSLPTACPFTPRRSLHPQGHRGAQAGVGCSSTTTMSTWTRSAATC